MTLPTPFSYRQVQGDGATTVFTFTFDYLEKAHVQVYLGTTLLTVGSGPSQYQWSADKQITLGGAPSTLQTLTIRRVTPESDQIIDWTDGSHLIADDLNTSDKQWLYLIQEHHDILMRMIYGLPPIPGPGIPVPALSFWNRLERGDDPNVGTTSEVAQTIGEDDQLKARATSAVQNGIDAYVMTLGALSARYDVIIGTGAGYPGAGNTGQVGKFRVDTSANPPSLYYWNGTAWAVVVTGGGGGQGTVTNVIGGPGITVTNPTTTPKISADVGNGLSLGSGDPDTIQVNAYHGITVDSNGVSVDPYHGITVGSAGVEVVGHHGITVNSNGVSVDPHWGINSDASGVWVNLNPTNPGLAVDANGLRTNGNQTNLGTVQFGTGTNYNFPATDGVGNAGNVLTTDGAGTLTWTSKTNPDGNTTYTLPVTSQNSGSTARLTLTASDSSGNDPVDIKAGTNISFTSINPGEFTINAAPGGGGGFETVLNTTALNTKAIAASRSPGDTFLVVDSTNIDSSTVPGTAPNEAPTVDGTAKVIAGLPTTPPSGGWGAAINVVVAWNSTDDGWDFVNYQAGQPDVRYAKSDVGNGTLAAFPPAGPKVGDIWYNLEDGRTYTYVDDGNTEQWVDTAPQGSGILWKQTTAGKIQPAVDTDDIRHPKFTGNVAGGTRAIMATAAGDLVANVVGPGLEISGGVLQVKRDNTADGTNLQSVCDAGNTTTTNVITGGPTVIGGTNLGSHIGNQGNIGATCGASSSAFRVWTQGTSTPTVTITGDGTASFTKNVKVTPAFATDIGFRADYTDVSGDTSYVGLRSNSTNYAFAHYSNATSALTFGVKIDGSADFKGNVTVGDQTNSYANLYSNGQLWLKAEAATITDTTAWIRALRDDGEKFRVNGDGSIVSLLRGPWGNDTQSLELNFEHNGSGTNTSATTTGSILFQGNGSTPRYAGIQCVRNNPSTGNGSDLVISCNAGGSSATAAQVARFTTAGNIQIMQGGSGIKFPASNTGSSDVNTLDDYEEGTFTPQIADAQSAGNIGTATTASGAYTKIGRLVTVQINLGGMDTTGMTGGNQLFIRNLPFNSASAMTEYTGSASLNLTALPDTVSLSSRVIGNSQAMTIIRTRADWDSSGAAIARASLTVGGVTSSSDIWASCQYFAST